MLSPKYRYDHTAILNYYGSISYIFIWFSP